jgi:hypothetical protein
MIKVFFMGEEKLIDAKADLEECVTFYRDAINIVQTRMLARILESTLTILFMSVDHIQILKSMIPIHS